MSRSVWGGIRDRLKWGVSGCDGELVRRLVKSSGLMRFLVWNSRKSEDERWNE